MTQTSANAEAVRFFHEALAADQNNDHSNAFQLIIASIAADPTLPGSWNNLGMTLHKLRKYNAAVAAFYKAHTLAPDIIMPLANYAWALQLAGRSEEALDIVINQIIPKDSDTATHWANLAQVNLTLNKLDPALAAAEKALALGDSRPDAKLVLALSQLRLGYYAEGLKNYEARMEVNPVLRLLLNHPYPVWRGEDISEKTLYIPCEQGLGDSVMILPFIIAAAKLAKKVVVHTHTPALKFFQRNLSAKNISVYPTPSELPPADYYCPSFSLPIALKLDDTGIVNTMHKLRFSAVHFTGFKKNPNDLNVGIVWAGDPNHDNDRWRSSNLESFMRLAEVPNIKLFSLQMGARKNDLDTLGVHGTVRNVEPFIRDVNDTAAFISQHLDAVVCVDTSVAHIAGSLGKRCYMLMGKHSVDWRWGCGDGSTVWYPNTLMFRQDVSGDWTDCVKRVMKELVK